MAVFKSPEQKKIKPDAGNPQAGGVTLIRRKVFPLGVSGLSVLAKFDAIFFDLDDTLITHSYGSGKPSARDEGLPDYLAALKKKGTRLLAISAYVEGHEAPALKHLGFPSHPPADIAEAETQKRQLIGSLLGEGLFDEVRTFPYASGRYAECKKKIFEELLVKYGLDPKKVLVVSDSSEEWVAANELGMSFIKVEPAEVVIEFRSAGRIVPTLQEMLESHIRG